MYLLSVADVRDVGGLQGNNVMNYVVWRVGQKGDWSLKSVKGKDDESVKRNLRKGCPQP